jgi:hypothetical protein
MCVFYCIQLQGIRLQGIRLHAFIHAYKDFVFWLPQNRKSQNWYTVFYYKVYYFYQLFCYIKMCCILLFFVPNFKEFNCKEFDYMHTKILCSGCYKIENPKIGILFFITKYTIFINYFVT